MSDQEDYQNRRDAVTRIAHTSIKTHKIPIDVYLQEAEDLNYRATQDFKQLHKAGLSRELLEELPIRIGVLRVAEAHWQAAKGLQRNAEKQWSQSSKAAYKLRNELMRALRYALRRQPNAGRPLGSIASGSGSGHADMIQDLASLAALARKHKAALASIGVSLELAEQANTTADTMATLFAKATNEKRSVHPAKQLRDQAYTYLKTVVDEIRDCGKFVFHHQPERRRGYTSAHRRAQNHTTRRKAHQRQHKNTAQTGPRNHRVI